MQVRATQLGYYDLKRRRPGDVFSISSEKHFSEKWMEKLEGASKSEAPQVLRKKGIQKTEE